MNDSFYVIVGAGGTGSLLLGPLVRYLEAYHRNTESEYRLSVIDGDHVEFKNLDRQMFTNRYVTTNKAEALVSLYGSRNTIAVPEFLTDENVDIHIKDGDIVIICADNYDVRARIERHALTLDNAVIINGGNESTTGSLQIFVRRNGVNVTPPLSWMHDEILRPSPFDPSKLDCLQRSQMPGGEQTIIANLASAAHILNALRLLLEGHFDTDHPAIEGLPDQNWHEIQFDLNSGNARAFNWRPSPVQA